MFIGHFAVGFAAKKYAPAVSLGSLFLSVQLVDLIWPTFLLLGLETVEIVPGITTVTPLDFLHYPWTHSLLAGGFWALLLGGVYYAIKKETTGSLILAGGVLSHWILDFISHRPDLLLFPGAESAFGLGLWHSLPATLIFEGLLFAGGLYLYLKTTEATSKKGTIALWSLAACLIIIYAGNLFGPPPPDVMGIAIMGHAQWLLVGWAFYIDKHRKTTPI